MTMLLHTLLVVAACFALHATLTPLMRGRHTSARIHYIVCLGTVVAYAAAYPFGPEAFRDVYLPVMLGQYAYDLIVIAADRRRLGRGYVRFYLAHHIIAFAVIAVWMAVFEVFTPSMAIGGLLFMSSDVWRWLQQLAHLGGRPSTERQRLVVFFLERAHRIACYTAGTLTILLGGQGWRTEEIIFCSCAVLMDVVDTSFQLQAMRQRRRKARKEAELRLAV